MSDEWGPWIEHDGRGCPVVGKYIQWMADEPFLCKVGHVDEFGRKLVAPDVVEGIAKDGGAWNWSPNRYHVIRYRVRRNREFEKLRDMVENLPADATEDALT